MHLTESLMVANTKELLTVVTNREINSLLRLFVPYKSCAMSTGRHGIKSCSVHLYKMSCLWSQKYTWP